MAEIVSMPQLGMTMEKGTITKWYKKENEFVKEGEPLFEVLTDKANMDVEAPVSGVLFKILFNEGEEVPVGVPVAVIRFENEKEEDATKILESIKHIPTKEKRKEEENIQASPSIVGETNRYVPATPYAKKLIKEEGSNLNSIEPNEYGYISSQEVKKFKSKQGPEEIKLSPIVRSMSLRMEESAKIPQFTLYYDVKADNLLLAKEILNKKGFDISLTVILAKIISETLIEFPVFSYFFKDGALLKNNPQNIGIAVATDHGLIVPVLKNILDLPLHLLLKNYTNLIEKAKMEALSLDDLEGGAVTISNLGMYGVDYFRALLVPNQSSIFAMSSIKDKPLIENGGLFIRKVFNLSITCDHRFIDGANAAKFMVSLKKKIEEWILEDIEKWQ